MKSPETNDRPMPPSKDALKEELLRLLQESAAAAERAHRTTTEGATHAEAKPENDKDTRALELTYLARGQAQRVDELRTAVVETRALSLRPFKDDEPATLGALVTVVEDDSERLLFIAPHGGGARLADNRIDVVTPKSPLGKALVGKRAGEECEVFLAGKQRELEIVRIQ